MGRVFCRYFHGDGIYECRNCRTHLAKSDDIISKAFQGRSGNINQKNPFLNPIMYMYEIIFI